MGCIFTAGWCVVSELVKSGRNIVGHRDVDTFLGVVPFDSEATIKFSFPVGGDSVKVLESFDEVVGIVLAYIFHTKVVNDKAERDVASVVAPETGGSRSWGVTVFSKVGGEANVGNESSLLEAVHALPNLNVNPAVWGDEVLQRVLVDDFLGNNAEGEPHVFVPLHGSVEVKVLDVGYHEAGVGGRDCTVEEALGGSKFCGGSASQGSRGDRRQR